MSRLDIIQEQPLVGSENSGLVDLQGPLDELQLSSLELQTGVVLSGDDRARLRAEELLGAGEELSPEHELGLEAVADGLELLRRLLDGDLDALISLGEVPINSL